MPWRPWRSSRETSSASSRPSWNDAVVLGGNGRPARSRRQPAAECERTTVVHHSVRASCARLSGRKSCGPRAVPACSASPQRESFESRHGSLRLHPLRPGTGRGPCGCGTAAPDLSVVCARLSGGSPDRTGRWPVPPGTQPRRWLRASLKMARGAAAGDLGLGRGGAGGGASRTGHSPQRAVTHATTKPQAKRPAARRVIEQKAVWLRCS